MSEIIRIKLRRQQVRKAVSGSPWEILIEKELLEWIRWRRYAPGWVLCSDQHQMNSLLLLVEGKVRVERSQSFHWEGVPSCAAENSMGKRMQCGRPPFGGALLGFLRPFSIIGHADLYCGNSEHLTYRAVSSCACLILPFSWIVNQGMNNRKFQWKLTQAIIQQSTWVVEQTAFMQNRSVAQRFADFLLEMDSIQFPSFEFLEHAYRHTKAGKPSSVNPETLERTAILLGCGLRQLLRVLEKFCACGCLCRDMGGYTVMDMNQLKEIRRGETRTRIGERPSFEGESSEEGFP